MAVPARGVLFEYGFSMPPLGLVFEFSPESISRTRTVTIKTGDAPGTRGGYDFMSPLETPRASQGIEMKAETFTFDVLFDATDKMAAGDPIATQFGVQPQIDTLRSMIEPKTQGPGGIKTLAALGQGGARAFERQEVASVLVFGWGAQVLPVFLMTYTQKELLHLPNLLPYQAKVTITLQVIESRNPFFMADRVRQVAMTALNLLSP
jgi:hypothetical protein